MLDLKLTLHRESGGPLYRQIIEQIRSLILQGDLAPGASIPTVRALAGDLQISNLTVFRAYEELNKLGLLESSPRQASRVAPKLPGIMGAAILSRLPERGPIAGYERLTQASGIRSMASSVGDPALFYADEFISEIESMRRESPWNFYYAESEGAPELLRQIAGILTRDRLETAESSLVATNGGTHALGIVLEAMSSPGDVVLVQEPGRLLLREQLKVKGLVGVPVRNSGKSIDLDHARYCIAQFRPKLFLASPDYGHCTGNAMPEVDRASLLELCQGSGVTIVEDGSCSALRYDDPPPPPIAALNPEAVAYIGSFSYSLCPGLRSGYVRLPRSLRMPVLAVSEATSISGPRFLQIALARYIERGGYDAHLKRVRPRYRTRRNALTTALQASMPPSVIWTDPSGGLSAWVTMAAGTSSSELYTKAMKHGIAFAPGKLFLTSDDAERCFRLSFGLLEPEAITETVRSLAKLIQNLAKG